MAVIEIAKIQIRRGQELQTGKPLTLDSGEFGWAVDTQKLYIGNGTVDEGAPATGITEIYTEHSISNIFNLAGSYVYQGNTSSSPVKTGPDLAQSSLHRSIQNKLDDIVSIADFGVSPHDTNTETIDGSPVYKQIQQAIDQIFLNSDKLNPQSRRKLHFPAGNYVITGTIYVPPYATLIGDGVDKTVLNCTSIDTAIMWFADGTSTPGFYKVGGDITSSGRPTGIYINGLTFKYDSTVSKLSNKPLLIIDAATDSEVTNCKFSGRFIIDVGITGDSYAGIDIRSAGAGGLISNNIKIKDNVFYSVKYGIKSDYDIEDVKIIGNKFYNLNRGISYFESPVTLNTIGPVRSVISENLFDQIKLEGIYVGSNSGNKPTSHVSSFNSFREVGNNLQGDGTGTNRIVTFLSPGNVSIGDIFRRDRFITTSGTDGSIYPSTISGKTYIESNKTYSTSIVAITNTVLARIPFSSSDQKINLQYILNKRDLGFSRKGTLTISICNLVSGTTTAVTDSYNYVDTAGTNGDGGITFSADITTATNQVRVLYYSTSPTGTLDYQYSYLQQ
jgi:hypothetical protein